MLGNLHVRFEKRDGETCLRKGMERFISTFTIVSISVDREMIVQRPAQCCKVVETVWDGVVPPEIFSREGALIRRSDVRSAVPMIWSRWRSIIFTSRSLAASLAQAR